MSQGDVATSALREPDGTDEAALRQLLAGLTAVRDGDFATRLPQVGDGLMDEIAGVFNGMADQLSQSTSEVTRVVREVGTEGKLGGQAQVPGVSGSWKHLTDSVNAMAGNLTGQVRDIAQVATAVARGDLSQKITVDAGGEIRELKTTINTMVDELSSFADEVTRVAREVGTEGRLGGQAEVEGVSGTWKRLTENVNELAGNLTRQVRAIAEVTSAVATGDLTRSISVEAQGEVAELKDNINAMVQSLRDSTRENQEQDWLKTNLAGIAGQMQGHRDLVNVAELIMDEITPLVTAQYGTFYLADSSGPETSLRLIAGYGHEAGAPTAREFKLGQSLVGQAARTKRTITVDKAPPGYVKVSSSLGDSAPADLIVLPIVFEGQVLGVIELASLTGFSQVHRDFLRQFTETIGVNLNTIIANARTDTLLGESQRLAAELRSRSEELQAQQEELQRSNAELEEKAALLARQNHDIEIKNFEIEQARQEIEERARQLALASKYKSEFLANMSHELRTPLNSLLILARILAQNPARNLTPKQVEFANIIHSAGTDLLQLINDVLDLSKVEAGKMDVHSESITVTRLLEDIETTFQPLTTEKGLEFRVDVGDGVPAEIHTDEQRLRQILRNLLSNAVKFTERGGVELRARLAEEVTLPSAEPGGPAIAFEVIDTGIGIAEENLEAIFGAFQQGDGTTSRRYGGTGLGLSISREVAGLLGGEIHAKSRVGYGTTFTLYLPPVAPRPGGFAAQATHGAPVADEVRVTAPRALPEPRRLLVLEQDGGLLTPLARSAAADLAETHGNVEITTATDADEAVDAVRAAPHTCVLLDPTLPVASAFFEKVDRQPALGSLPVLAHPGRRLSAAQERLVAARARSHPFELLPSLDGLRERVALYLSGGRLVDALPFMAPPARSAGDGSAADEDAGGLGYTELSGRRVLIIDDDVRNVFAISSVLELYGMSVIHAPNGKKGIEVLRRHQDVELVLMDIMMPEMDGYATTAAIREMPQFADLPIIAVTARAMHGDREKSLSAGATDHVAKPVDTDELLACMKRWLHA